jgi:cytochrome b pre-mRNA-processing protein 3
MPGPFNQWLKFFTPRSRTRAANKLYLTLVAQSREPGFYLSCAVPDTVDGRFDMIAVHCFLVMNRLKERGTEADKLSQVLFDEMFNDMDRGLRELGVGDMGVGRRVRAMAKAYLGRVAAYHKALESDPEAGAQDDPVPALRAALARNLYRGEDVPEDAMTTMADYVVAQYQHLSTQADEDLLAGDVKFGPAPMPTGERMAG